MTEFYDELYILPSALHEVFSDFILEHTQEAIEELQLSDIDFAFLDSSETSDLSAHPSSSSLDCINLETPISSDLDSVNSQFLDRGDPSENGNPVILVRSSTGLDSLLADLKKFTLVLSDRMGFDIHFKYAIRRRRNEDWIQKYRQSVMPICVGDFYIRPSWHLPLPQSDFSSRASREVIIDPALAFGSGHHATTSMCIEMLSEMNLVGTRVLDVGCGSGILGLVAKMNGAHVSLCDTDLLAIEESKKNFANNHQEIDEIWQGSILVNKGSYGVIVANILADVIKMLYNDFCRVTERSSVIILSGILDKYEQGVLECFQDFSLIKRIQKDEWIALKLLKNKG